MKLTFDDGKTHECPIVEEYHGSGINEKNGRYLARLIIEHPDTLRGIKLQASDPYWPSLRVSSFELKEMETTNGTTMHIHVHYFASRSRVLYLCEKLPVFLADLGSFLLLVILFAYGVFGIMCV